MTPEETGQGCALILATLLVATAIWLTWGSEYEAHVETVIMPDGTEQRCTFVGYGRTRTLLECEDESQAR